MENNRIQQHKQVEDQNGTVPKLTGAEKVVTALAATVLGGGVLFGIMHLKPLRALLKIT
ncbi:MAG: hypothetical protein JSR80_00920 [Verrucomicrobia bacterium]|nr:hypothetical protein [Verrucomicrobiota bacterium]